ncbi:CCA tRNA nucleotidyltransferase 1, mitochondrial isoform X2 [Hermetia illucens]|nr:CCA tRNA nucleotidyltransferase 1, mitochondrial isoform X2 [Hermetia illucens]
MEGTLRVRKDPVVVKLDTPEFKSIFTNELYDLIDLFKKYGHEIRIAGGAVRDILMNISPKDIDFATTATPDQMKDMFNKENIRMINMKGEKHGTITPRINDKENFEITTLRIDVLTDGRHAEVKFTTDWQLDANRRDLTINSMFLGFDGSVYDYFYGYDDLKMRRVVFVGDPDTRIKEDFLRILRYFRFYGRIANSANNHDQFTLEAIKNNATGLQKISGERIWSEVRKLLVGNFAQELMLTMLKCGIGKYIGLPDPQNIEEFNRVMEASKAFKDDFLPIMFMTGLLHSPEDAMKLHERLKLSAYERDLALFLTQNRESARSIDDLKSYKKLCMQPYAKREYVEELLRYNNMPELYKQLKEWKSPSFPINGSKLKDNGCPPGATIGVVMNQLKGIWADEDFKINEEDLLRIHLPKILEDVKANPPQLKKQKVNK